MQAETFLTRVRALSVDDRIAIAMTVAECGHALSELELGLGHLERELAAAYQREAGPLEAVLEQLAA